MLFYVQMRWNYQGRISQDQLWDLEALEGAHGVEGIRAGFVQLYKVVSQHRIIAIVKADSLDNLDRNSMGWLPMREFLEFEQVWALREYEGFLDDVKAKFPPRDQLPAPASAQSSRPSDTREIATAWFRNLEQGKFDDALQLVDPDARARGQRPRAVARLVSRAARRAQKSGPPIRACWPSGCWATR